MKPMLGYLYPDLKLDSLQITEHLEEIGKDKYPRIFFDDYSKFIKKESPHVLVNIKKPQRLFLKKIRDGAREGLKNCSQVEKNPPGATIFDGLAGDALSEGNFV
jgi:hypothetical protein